MSKDDCLAVLDIGTSKTVALVLDVGHHTKPQVRGSGLAATLGLHKCKVVDAEALAFSLRNALYQARQNAGCQVNALLCNTVGIPVQAYISNGTTAIDEQTREICDEDIGRVVEASKVLPLNSGQEIIRAAPQCFHVDGKPVNKVLGAHGTRLDVETCMVTADAQNLAELAELVNSLGVAPLEGWIHNGTALAGTVLSVEERHGRTLVMDLGAGTSDVTLVEDGRPIFAFSLPVAGRHITNDLSIGLGVGLDEAESLKTQFGTACAGISDSGIAPESADDGAKSGVPRQVLGEIIEARLREIFLLIEQQLKQAGHDIPASIVLTGGTAMLPGLDMLLASMWTVKTRVANPPRVNGMPVNFNNAAYATAAAMSLYAAQSNGTVEKTEKRVFKGIFDKISACWKAFSGI